MAELIPAGDATGTALSPLQRLRQRVQSSGSRTAYLQKRHGVWQPWSWQRLADAVDAWAAGLLLSGLPQGAGVAILSGARVEAVVAEWACLQAGMRPVLMNPNLPPGALATWSERAEVVAFIAEDQEQVDKIADIQSRLPSLGGVWVIDPKGTRTYRHIEVRSAESFSRSLPAQQHRLSVADVREPTLRGNERVRMFTSGAARDARAVDVDLTRLDRLESLGTDLGLRADLRLVSLFALSDPLGHFLGVLAPLLYGSVTCFGEDRLPMVSELRQCAPEVVALPTRAMDRLRREAASQMQRTKGLRGWWCRRWSREAEEGSGLLSNALVGAPLARSLGLGACKRVLTAFETFSPASASFLKALRVRCDSLYVAAECTGPLGWCFTAQGSRLTLFPGVRGTVGRDQTLVIDADGLHLATGDLVRTQGDAFELEGRAADQLLLSGGQAVSPRTLEQRLLSCPYVQQAVAVGGPSQGVSMLIELDELMVREWARLRGLAFTTTRSLAQSDELQQLMATAVAQANEGLATALQIRRFLVLPRPLDASNGELSPSMAVRRTVVRNRYAHRLTSGAIT